MARILQRDPFHFRNTVKEGLIHEILGDVVSPVENQGGRSYLVELVDDRPVFELPRETVKVINMV